MNASIRPDAPWPDDSAHVVSKRGNRRRLLVFGIVFVIVMLAGQAWNFSRPDEFRTSTRLQISLSDATGATETVGVVELTFWKK